MKKVKVVLMALNSGDYKVVQLTNAAMLTAKNGSPIIIGMVICARDADEFARDRRWECTIKSDL